MIRGLDTQKPGPTGTGTSADDGEKERHEVYIPPKLKQGDQLVEERKELDQRAGFRFEELLKAPVKVSGDNPPQTKQRFEDFGFAAQIMDNLKKCDYKQPTPIQQNVISCIMAKRDVLACGQTGSGKTAAYILPIIHGIMQSPEDAKSSRSFGLPCMPNALILAPVRELAIQIAKESHLYNFRTLVKSLVVYGGTSLSANINELKTGCNILVATPGRLLQLLLEEQLTLSEVKFIVVDEADKMLEHGFIKDLKRIVNYLPWKRTTAMFSATFPPSIQRMAYSFLTNYIFVCVGVLGGASFDVKQIFEPVEQYDKYSALLKRIYEMSETEKMLIFCETRHRTEELGKRLAEEPLPAGFLHGLKYQSERESTLEDFKYGRIKLLVATAVASRGLDIPKVSIVVNYDLPKNIDDYVQQIGRTGRVGNVGKSISFFELNRDGPMAPQLASMLRMSGQRVSRFLEDVAQRELEETDTDVGGNYSVFPVEDYRQHNALGQVTSGVPLPCEIRNETWD